MTSEFSLERTNHEFARARAVYEEGRVSGLHSGVSVFVSQNGKSLLHEAWGENSPGESVRNDHSFLWLSAGKPITAVAIGQCFEAGLLEWETPISKVIPEFAQGGKREITIAHALTHTGGFRGGSLNWIERSFEELVAESCAIPFEENWTLGETAGYHVASSWFVLGEVVQRLTGTPFRDYVRHRIFLPLGMSRSWIGMDQESWEIEQPRIGYQYQTEPPVQDSQSQLSQWHTKEACLACSPGGGARGPVAELGRFYEALLNSGEGILRAETVQTLIQPRRIGAVDRTFRHKIDWGLGIIVQSNQYGWQTVPYGFGRFSSPRTFGHGGYQSSIGMADPDHGLVIAYVFNGTPGEAKHNRRSRSFLSAIYEDLGIAKWE